MKIPIRFVNTVHIDDRFMSATRIIGGGKYEGVLTESGCIIVEMRADGPEVSGTLEPDLVNCACWLAGNGNMRIGDAMAIATSENAHVSENTSISVALRAA